MRLNLIKCQTAKIYASHEMLTHCAIKKSPFHQVKYSKTH